MKKMVLGIFVVSVAVGMDCLLVSCGKKQPAQTPTQQESPANGNGIQPDAGTVVVQQESLTDTSSVQTSAAETATDTEKVSENIVPQAEPAEVTADGDKNTLVLSADNIIPTSPVVAAGGSFRITGKNSKLYAKDKLAVKSDSVYRLNATVKNTGTVATRAYIGYRYYDEANNILDSKAYPYQKNKESFSVYHFPNDDDSSFVINKMPKTWAKKCRIAYGILGDGKDVPSVKLLDGAIVDIVPLDNGTALVKMDKPIAGKIKMLDKVRIHGVGGAFIYMNTKVLQPGEAETFTSEIAQDPDSREYSSKAISAGVAFINPIILSYSVDSGEENTVEVSNWSVAY